MKDLIEKYERKRPEIVFEWKDPETEAEGWVVINSLRGGAAGGGTRMRKGLDRHEVESLAKTMEVKFTVSGPPIGGAKSGINFDPADPRKGGVLKRWFLAVSPLLKHYYGTGGDLNIDEIHEVIPITEDYGIWHPQEGVVVGHFKPDKNDKIRKIGQLRKGVSKVIDDPDFSPTPGNQYLIADMITGYGVAESIRHYYDIYGGKLQGKRAIIQGWGNVAAAAGYYLSRMGVSIVGIIDRNGGLIREEGFTPDEVTELFLNRKGNQLIAPGLMPFNEINKQIWGMPADIFVPAAASRLLTAEQVQALITGGCEVIACGANVPFADREIFFGPTGELADSKMSVIPDFISNCGMARVFAYLMQNGIDYSDKGIFSDVSLTIRHALMKTHALSSSKTHIAKTAFEIALRQLI
ncbi:MAG TPA: Glu/Leu/Phe/Val dehydrogenase dimerization domain-containing protein [Bacteroidia bacterium]|jgi:glutamate dehydrogenase/leucine dehydrogenase|nr:Glu/Leu/Phe/Val dehydrogenase dimerization domain-containing protein [Bacteroidia bacterium]